MPRYDSSPKAWLKVLVRLCEVFSIWAASLEHHHDVTLKQISSIVHTTVIIPSVGGVAEFDQLEAAQEQKVTERTVIWMDVGFRWMAGRGHVTKVGTAAVPTE